MLNHVKVGAQVSMTPPEVDALCGDGDVRLVTCPNGRVMGGFGAVGLVERVGDANLAKFMDAVKDRRDEVSRLAKDPQPTNPRANLYTFTRI